MFQIQINKSRAEPTSDIFWVGVTLVCLPVEPPATNAIFVMQIRPGEPSVFRAVATPWQLEKLPATPTGYDNFGEPCGFYRSASASFSELDEVDLEASIASILNDVQSLSDNLKLLAEAGDSRLFQTEALPDESATWNNATIVGGGLWEHTLLFHAEYYGEADPRNVLEDVTGWTFTAPLLASPSGPQVGELEFVTTDAADGRIVVRFDDATQNATFGTAVWNIVATPTVESGKPVFLVASGSLTILPTT